MIMHQHAVKVGGIVLPMLLLATPAWPQEFEAAPVFQATDLVPADRLSGPGYQVAPEVRNDGLLNHYTLGGLVVVVRKRRPHQERQR